jgi:MFS family permease
MNARARREEPQGSKTSKTVMVAWVGAAIFHFYQCSLRSAPSVMMADLSAAFGISTLAVASISGLFYYGYAPFNMVAGAAIDELGPRQVVPIGAAVVATGVILFATGDPSAASVGRLLQGVGSAFAAVGAIYMASKYFPASQTATLVGATQMFGMAGAAAGQFAIAPIISTGVSWKSLWAAMSVAGIALGVLLAFLLPKKDSPVRTGWLKPRE